jgi:hypothetical protein
MAAGRKYAKTEYASLKAEFRRFVVAKRAG